MSVTMLSSSFMLALVILPTALWDDYYYYSPFRDKVRWSSLPGIMHTIEWQSLISNPCALAAQPILLVTQLHGHFYMPWIQESLLFWLFFSMPVELVSVARHVNLCTTSENNRMLLLGHCNRNKKQLIAKTEGKRWAMHTTQGEVIESYSCQVEVNSFLTVPPNRRCSIHIRWIKEWKVSTASTKNRIL